MSAMVIRVVAAAMLLAACSPATPRYFGPQLAWVPDGVDPAAINSAAFVKQTPPPGSPGYLETIRYIDDGVKYIDQYSEFFVSFDGQLCFRGLVNLQQAEFENYQNYWCIPPGAVHNIDALENDVSYVNEVRLWCGHSAPQCARRFGYANFLDESNWLANSISAQIVPFKQERRAIGYLIYLMGGSAKYEPLLR
jgi:hypothetical protein